MDNMSLVKKLPPMLSGRELEQALAIFPEYDPEIVNQSEAVRLIALSDLYRVFVPGQMSKEIYSKLYLALLRSLQKKEDKLAVKQRIENHKATIQQNYWGVLGGADSFSIIGCSGIGKTSSISRAVQLISQEPVIEMDKPYCKILPCVVVTTPFDSSVKNLLLEILRQIDEQLGSNYYSKTVNVRTTTDQLIGVVSQVALNHIGILVIDELQHILYHKNGQSIVGCLTQLINNSGISICMVACPEVTEYLSKVMQLARRALGLQYDSLEYGEEFERLCKTLFQYQYVRNRTEIDDAIIHWLYEHSNGNVSTVVSLLHDAQEIGILEGSEILNMETLNAAYKNRMKMLHSFIRPSKKPQTSNRRKASAILKVDRQVEDVISISTLIQQAKSENRDIVSFLKPHITIEEVVVV